MTEGVFASGLGAVSRSAGTARGGGAAALSLPDHIPTRRFSTLHSSITNSWTSKEETAAADRTEACAHTFFCPPGLQRARPDRCRWKNAMYASVCLDAPPAATPRGH